MISTSGGMISGSALNRMEIPPMEYILYPHIPRKSVVLVHGTTKIGKTWFVLQLAKTVCSGPSVQFLGWTSPKSFRVLYVSLEMDKVSIRMRIDRQYWTDEALENFTISTERMRLNPLVPEHWGILIKMIEESKADLLIIDPLGRVDFGSKYDFNDFLTANRFIDQLKAVVLQTNCSVILVHHNRKGNDFGDAVDSATGSKGLANSCEVVISLRPVPNRTRVHYVRRVEVVSRVSWGEEEIRTFDHEELLWRRFQKGDSNRRFQTEEEKSQDEELSRLKKEIQEIETRKGLR